MTVNVCGDELSPTLTAPKSMSVGEIDRSELLDNHRAYEGGLGCIVAA